MTASGERRKRPGVLIPNTALGQNFLENPALLDREIIRARIKPEDTVLEIGPGTGNLTRRLVKIAARIVAIEIDGRFQPVLAELEARHPNLKILWDDALTVPFPPFTKVVANLPYNVALPLTFKLLEQDFHSGVLILQESLARRFCAKPGEPGYSRITVTAFRLASFTYLETIRPNAFVPPPKVDSGMVHLHRKRRASFPIPGEEKFKHFLDAVFMLRDRPLEQAIGYFWPAGTARRIVASLPRPLLVRPVERIDPRGLGAAAMAAERAGAEFPEVSAEEKRKAQKFLPSEGKTQPMRRRRGRRGRRD